MLEDRYRIVGELGAGGIGRVFRAEHMRLGHHVAVKVLLPHFLDHPQFRPRFEREARALARLAHPHVVAWTDYSIANGFPYLVMEVLSGRPLRVDIAQGPMNPKRAHAIVRQILGTLIYAHRVGFVHRDLKPGNVFLLDLPGEPDFVKILDFGFVKLLDAESGRVGPDQSQLTVSGMGVGTPSYMSPEQAAGDTTGPASDLYSLGIILFELLTGKRPFRGDIVAIMRQQMTDPLPVSKCGEKVMRPELRAFLERATAKRPSERFESAELMLRALDALPQPWLLDEDAPPPPVLDWRSPKLRTAALFAGVVLLLILLGLIVIRAPAEGTDTEGREATSTERRDPPREPVRQPVSVPAIAGPSQAPAAPSPATPSPAEQDVAAPAASSANAAEPSPAPAAEPAALGPSPFDALPRTPLLWNAHLLIMNGHVLSTSTEAEIERWGRTEPQDPRPTLLLAANATRRHRDDRAVFYYRAAFRTDPSARNDPRMLRHLIRIASTESAQAHASEALVTIYGVLARPAIDAELARRDLSRSARERLIALRAELAR